MAHLLLDRITVAVYHMQAQLTIQQLWQPTDPQVIRTLHTTQRMT